MISQKFILWKAPLMLALVPLDYFGFNLLGAKTTWKQSWSRCWMELMK